MRPLKVTTESGNVYWLQPQDPDGQPILVWLRVECVRGRNPDAYAVKTPEGVIGWALHPPSLGRGLVLGWTHRERGPQIRITSPVVEVVQRVEAT